MRTPSLQYLRPAQLCLALAALAGTSGAQAGTPSAGPPRAPSAAVPMGQWMLLDRVEIIANTSCLTLRDLDEKVNRDDRMTGTAIQEKYQALRTTIAIENVNELLKRQAGEDLGFDESMVRARANDIWDERVSEQGGVVQATRKLNAESETVVQKRDEITGDIYSSSWTQSVLGRDAGPGGRPVYDRYTRPGQMRQTYKRLKVTGLGVVEALGPVGASPARYEFELLLITPERLGGAEAALTRARQVRAALKLDALDWEDTLTNLGSLADPRVPVDRTALVRSLDPGSGALVSFADEAQEGGYSEVLPYAPMDSRGQRRLEGYAIYKLLGRTPAIVPDFTQQGVQKQLQRYMQFQRDSQRYETELSELRAKAYVWYPGIEKEKAEVEAALEARKRKILEAREQNAAEQEAAREEQQADQPGPEEGAGEGSAEPKPAPAEGVDEGAPDEQPAPAEGGGR